MNIKKIFMVLIEAFSITKSFTALSILVPLIKMYFPGSELQKHFIRSEFSFNYPVTFFPPKSSIP